MVKISHWYNSIDRATLFTLFGLIVFGCICVGTASPSVAERINLDSYHFLYRHLLFVAAGLGAMLTISFFSVLTIRRLAVFLFGGCLILMVYVLFNGVEVKGATRWIGLFSFTLQPSEFMKPFFIVTVAWMYSEKLKNKTFPGHLLGFVFYLIAGALIIAQPDIGMLIVVTTIWISMFFLSGLRIYWVLILCILALVFLVVAYTSFDHVAKRIDTFLDPENNETFQIDRSIEAIKNGGIFGKGWGEGTIKNSIPDSHTDFIFAVIVEEGGLIISLLYIVAICFLVLRCYLKIFYRENMFILLSCFGILTLFAVQSFVNIGVSVGALPTKGMTLPLISYGGSSFVSTCIGFGIVLALTKKRGAINYE